MRLRALPGRIRQRVSGLRELRLRTQYALVLLAILLVLATVVVGSAEFFQRQTIQQEQADLNETAGLAADQIGESVTGSEAYLRGQSSSFGVNLSNRTEVLEQTVTNSEFLLALVTDRNGTVLGFRGDIENESIRNETIGSDLSEEKYISAALEGQTYIQEPSRGDAGITLTMSTPITIAQQPRGVLVGTVLIGTSAGVDGTGPAGLDYFGALQPLNTSTQSATVEQATDDGPLQIHSAGDPFENSLSGEATVDSTGWTVTVQRDRAALTNRLQLFQYIQFGSLVVVLLSVFGLGFYQYRTNLRQTERLLDGFDALTNGEFDHRLGFSGAREWEQISAGFNTMAGGLAEREQTIRERERQIREREQRLSVLNRVLRHNMQNDMNVIQGYADIIADSDSPEKQRQSAEIISETAEGLVEHSRKARRLETVIENAQEGHSEIDIVSEVERILTECAREHPEVTVEADVPDRAPVVGVAGVEFGVESLVENAFEHAGGSDPEVRVTVRRDNGQTHVEVCDNGPGIPDHEREVLLQDEETSLEHGSGIGLWLAYWATTKSGGQLQFGDQTDGGVVTVSLPSADPPENPDATD